MDEWLSDLGVVIRGSRRIIVFMAIRSQWTESSFRNILLRSGTCFKGSGKDPVAVLQLKYGIHGPMLDLVRLNRMDVKISNPAL